MKTEYKQMIPNILTIIRISLTPILILLSFLGYIKTVIILSIIAALTDMLDGKLARYWNVTSLKGAKLDAVADKVFAIGLIICLIPKNDSASPLFALLALEVIITITNLYYHYKTGKTESLMIGKFKTTFLFITIICSFITITTHHLSIFFPYTTLFRSLKVTTINLQILSLISYFLSFYQTINQKKLSVENNDTHQQIMNDDLEDIEEKTIQVDNLIELTKKYGLYNQQKDDIQ